MVKKKRMVSIVQNNDKRFLNLFVMWGYRSNLFETVEEQNDVLLEMKRVPYNQSYVMFRSLI